MSDKGNSDNRQTAAKDRTTGNGNKDNSDNSQTTEKDRTAGNGNKGDTDNSQTTAKDRTVGKGKEKPDHALEIANQSGFPLQIAVAKAVDRLGGVEWEVSQMEQFWKNERLDRSGYIDIVVRDAPDMLCLVCECKRYTNAQWVFMAADGEVRNTTSRVLIAKPDRKDPASPSKRKLAWIDLSTSNLAAEAMFCAVRGAGEPGKHGTIERIASEVVAATEALAHSELDMVFGPEHIRCYASVIVTTAELHIIKFDPWEIDIAEGKLPADARSHAVPIVRLRKQLSEAHRRYSEHDAWASPTHHAAQLEQTVFIVNSRSFGDFLKNIDPDGSERQRLMMYQNR